MIEANFWLWKYPIFLAYFREERIVSMGFPAQGVSKIRFRRQIFLCGRLLATSPFEEKSGEHPLEVAAFLGGAGVFAQQSPRQITPENLRERAAIVRGSGIVLRREADV